MAKKLILPRRYIVTNSTFKTIATRGKGGRFTGRKNVGGFGDRTSVRIVKQDVDVNHDGIIDFKGGTVQGRNKSVSVKASKRARGYVREL